jgi:hypothetical protein
MGKCKCGKEFVEKEFKFIKIVYCEDCGCHETIHKECIHETIPVKMVTSNGSIQVRRFCKTCGKLDSKILKQKDFNLSLLPEKKMSEYYEYLAEIDRRERGNIDELLDHLNKEKYNTLIERYKRYIQSPEWKVIRKLALERDNFSCRICLKPAKQVHHLTYVHLEHEFLFELVSLCLYCHETEYPSSFRDTPF